MYPQAHTSRREIIMQTQKLKGQKVYMIAALGVAVVGILLYAIVNIAAIKEFIGRIWVIFAPGIPKVSGGCFER